MTGTPPPTPIGPMNVADAVVQAAPWWGVPLLAGTFLLLGAVIAFVSTYFSDRRKLAREDQRQWDKEIRDLYMQMSAQCALITQFRHSTAEVQDGRAHQISAK